LAQVKAESEAHRVCQGPGHMVLHAGVVRALAMATTDPSRSEKGCISGSFQEGPDSFSSSSGSVPPIIAQVTGPRPTALAPRRAAAALASRLGSLRGGPRSSDLPPACAFFPEADEDTAAAAVVEETTDRREEEATAPREARDTRRWVAGSRAAAVAKLRPFRVLSSSNSSGGSGELVSSEGTEECPPPLVGGRRGSPTWLDVPAEAPLPPQPRSRGSARLRPTFRAAGACAAVQRELVPACLRPSTRLPSTPVLPRTRAVNEADLELSSRTPHRTVTAWLPALLDAPDSSPSAAATIAEPAPPLERPHRTAAGGISSLSLRSAWRSLAAFPPASHRASTSPAGAAQPPSSASPPSAGAAPRSVLSGLRDHFQESVGAECSGRISRQELFSHIRGLAEAQRGPLSEELLELLDEVVRRRFAEIDLGLEDTSASASPSVGVDEWVHFMMLRGSAPSHVAMKLLNRRLRRALAKDKSLLVRMHQGFEAADALGVALAPSQAATAFSAAELARAANVDERTLAAPGAKAPTGAHPSADAALVAEPEAEPEDGEEGLLDYCEFVSHALGAQACTVEIALYDLSQGLARWVPPALLGGHRFEGIWHSGVRVFDKEFWFGGAILESRLDEIPFGQPVRIVRLGTTLRTHEELLEFLRNDVYENYNPRSYDVLRRNCNHFSDELLQFLLHGQRLPEEVLMQPEWAQSVSIVRVMRPILNRLLGGFGDEVMGSPKSPCTPHVMSRIDDMTQEWRSRLQVGDIVLHRARFIDRPWVVRIVALSRDYPRVAEVVFFRPIGARWEDVSSMLSLGELWTWEVVRQMDVPLREFYPLLNEADAGAQLLRAGLSVRDPRAGCVLQRRRAAPPKPLCPRGHRLHAEASPYWFRPSPPCGICAGSVGGSAGPGSRQACARCSWAVCGACLARGCGLPGGGAFADILSPELAQGLLADAGWLKYKARSYFFKADHNEAGGVDKVKARRVNQRLAAELGVSQLKDEDLALEMKRLGQVQEALPPPPKLMLDEVAFEQLFASLLSRALKRLETDSLRRRSRHGDSSRAAPGDLEAV